MSPIAAARPSMVVLVLNLRRMHETPRISPVLCSRLSPAALLAAARLPLGDIGLRFPRLLVTQLLRWPVVRTTSESFERVRSSARRMWVNVWYGALGRIPPPRTGEEMMADQWRKNVVERADSTRMLAATVRLARSSGAAVFVVVSPAPVGVLTEANVWDAAAYARQIQRYRAVVEDAGGELVDLHQTVGVDGFRSAGAFTPFDAHLNSAGAVRVAAALGPRIMAALDGSPR